jgi:hypothetical protein
MCCLLLVLLLLVLLRRIGASGASKLMPKHQSRTLDIDRHTGEPLAAPNQKHLRAPTLRSSFFTLQEATSTTRDFSAILYKEGEE